MEKMTCCLICIMSYLNWETLQWRVTVVSSLREQRSSIYYEVLKPDLETETRHRRCSVLYAHKNSFIRLEYTTWQAWQEWVHGWRSSLRTHITGHGVLRSIKASLSFQAKPDTPPFLPPASLILFLIFFFFTKIFTRKTIVFIIRLSESFGA